MAYDGTCCLFLPHQQFSFNEESNSVLYPCPHPMKFAKQKEKLCPIPLGTFNDRLEIVRYLTAQQCCNEAPENYRAHGMQLYESFTRRQPSVRML